MRRPRAALGPALVARLLSALVDHLRTHRLVRPNALATSSALSPVCRRRTASLRNSFSDTWAPRSSRRSEPSGWNDVLRLPDLTSRNDVMLTSDLAARNDVVRFTPERCPAVRHLGWSQ